MILRRRSFNAALAGSTLAAIPTIGRAQAPWPNRPVRIVTPFAAGGAADTLARILSEQFPSMAGGQPLIVENKPGAGGTVAAGDVARGDADGYSLLLGDIGANAVAQALFPSLAYDVEKSFQHVIHLANLPMVMIAHPSVADGGIEGLIRRAKEKPDALNYASAGAGGASHLMMELFNKAAGIRITHIPYRGGGPVLAATMNNEVQVSISTISTSRSFIESDKVKAIGVGSRMAVASLPGVPPIASVLPGFEALTWHGVHVAAATPTPIVQRINEVFNTLLKHPEVIRKMAQQTAEPVGGTPQAYANFVSRETSKWGEVVRTAGIKPA